MKIRDEEIDKLFMEIIDMLGKTYDTTLDQATNVAEQIAEKVNDILEDDEIE